MTNNDLLRSIRYALELEPTTLQGYFQEGGERLSLVDVASMLKDEGEPGAKALDDGQLARFLDGLVAKQRGPRDADTAAAPKSPERLTNNRILRALRIAFSLRDTDVAEVMAMAGRTVGKTELGALFRREDHRNYQPCGDQFLRAFIRGLGIWHRQGRPRSP
jgi:uncharacterized protein YehS (DUF1456 family)